MGRDQIIETYVQRLFTWEEPLTADSLSNIAQEVGLGPDDMAAVQQKAQAHLECGRSYLEFDCLDEAIDELTQATVLDPLNLEILQNLACAYDQRYAKSKRADDKKQAIAFSKRCLEINPNSQKSVILLSTTEHEADGRLRLFLVWLVTVVTALVGFKFVVDIALERSELEQLSQDALLDAADSLSTPIDYSWNQLRPEKFSFKLASRSEEFDSAGPIRPNTNIPEQGHSGAGTFKAEWLIVNTSDVPIHQLKLQVDFYIANDEFSQGRHIFAIQKSDAPLQPGEARLFLVIQPIIKGYERYEVSVVDIE